MPLSGRITGKTYRFPRNQDDIRDLIRKSKLRIALTALLAGDKNQGGLPIIGIPQNCPGLPKFSEKEALLSYFVESGGDNLAASFSPELVDTSIYVIDVAGGDKVPRKGDRTA